ncbi:MAG: class I SAM-dependent methyltransferase [Phycisphaeraceae bacterium]
MKLYPTDSISGQRFYLYRCLNCRAVFLGPRPTGEQLDQAYDESYYGKGEAKFTGLIEKVLDQFRSARARRVRRYIAPPAKILDIGCGNGRFLGCLIEQGFDGYGIELSGKAAQRARQIPGVQLKVGRLEAADYNEHVFDGICMWHVFEHLTEPKTTLRIIRKILKPDGYLLMSTPNIDSVQSKLFRGHWLHLDPPKHLFFLGASDLTAAMRGFGFKLIEQRHFSLEHNPFGLQQSILNCLLGQREVLFEALKGNNTHVKDYSRWGIAVQKWLCLGSFPVFAMLAGLEAVLRRGGTMELVFQKERDAVPSSNVSAAVVS